MWKRERLRRFLRDDEDREWAHCDGEEAERYDWKLKNDALRRCYCISCKEFYTPQSNDGHCCVACIERMKEYESYADEHYDEFEEERELYDAAAHSDDEPF